MTYPEGLTVIPLEKLRTVTDNTDVNNINVFLGSKKKDKSDATFVVLKVSERGKVIAPSKMEEHGKALERGC